MHISEARVLGIRDGEADIKLAVLAATHQPQELPQVVLGGNARSRGALELLLQFAELLLRAHGR